MFQEKGFWPERDASASALSAISALRKMQRQCSRMTAASHCSLPLRGRCGMIEATELMAAKAIAASTGRF